jgi:2-polyprenyl-3-methyl-5-hydroxy-6-metoxy-1,4-benzoquinol methylase
MKPEYRNKCVISNDNDLELIYNFKKFPTYMGCVSCSDIEQDIFLDLNFYISKTTGCVQINPLVPIKTLYKDSHGSGSVGKSWEKHHKALAKFIHKFGSKNIFEIGGGHGVLAMKYLAIQEDAHWAILEANPTPKYNHKQISFQKGIFDEHCNVDSNVDTIVHSHLFEHTFEPKIFLEQLYKHLPLNGYTIFSVPYLEQQIRENFTYCLGFEHTFFLNEVFIEYLLSISGFKLIDKKIHENNHSIFYCAKKIKKNDQHLEVPLKYNEYLELFKNYFAYNKNKVDEYNKLIQNTEKPIYLFGAHAASQYLISYGLQTKKIINIIDNDKNKRHKRLYGTKLTVQSPSILSKHESAYVLLRQGVFNKEIKKDILENINSQIEFWE